jgi:hypothetical protein
MGHANWRLDNPPVVDVGVSRRMGLFVVGRLAARHGVRVRLRHASAGGLTALVWLPDTVAAQEGAPLGRLRRFEAEDYGPSPSLSAPPAGGTGGALPTRQTGNAAAQAAAAARMPRFSPPGGTPPQPRVGTGPQPLVDRPGNAVTRGFTPPGQSSAASPQGPGTADPGAAPGGNGFSMPFRPTAGGIPTAGPPGGPASPGPWSPAGAQPGNGSTLGPPNGDNGVRVPAPPENGHDQRLPIFDTLESDWFRRSGTSHVTSPAPGSEASTASVPDQAAWHSPADEGWRAAETVAAPSTGTNTSAGLPRRVPRANLVPGSVGEPAADPSGSGGPSRSAEDVRNRLASFQRGVREARASAPKTEEPQDG